ncbi:hypothetical protein BGX28_002833 [Mortierella sp. GBA30]|nr:hypothetical protein BGX28_002833 [Mortierella sp. GBA30]
MTILSTTSLREEPRPQRIDLGDGLIMRWSTRADKDNVADCLAESFKYYQLEKREIPIGELPDNNEYFKASSGRVLSGRHVVVSEFDFAVVEDTTLIRLPGKNPIVAAMSLQQYAGYYGSIDMNYGVAEEVGSVPGYRNRGLIKKLFLEMVHPAADERGDLIILIPGIPHFYRQFGYEYAIPQKISRMLMDPMSAVPALPKGKTEPFMLREANSFDIPYLVKMSTPERLHSKAQVGLYYDYAFWTFIVNVLTREATQNFHDAHHHACIVVDSNTGRDVGISLSSHVTNRWGWEIFSLEEDLVHYRHALPSILRQLKYVDRPHFECYCAKLNNNILPDESDVDKRKRGQWPALQFSSLEVKLAPSHPVIRLLDGQGKLGPQDCSRLYTRIASLPKYIQKIAPVLENRLKESALKGISARMQINFFKRLEGMSGKGLEIVFASGHLVEAVDWVPHTPEQSFLLSRQSTPAQDRSGKTAESMCTKNIVVLKAHFAPLTFTRLITGTITVDELLSRDSENEVEGAMAKMMLEILFPKVEHLVDLMWW